MQASMKISWHLDKQIERYDGYEMGFLVWLFGSKPSLRIDGFESMTARVFVLTWSAHFASIRVLLRVDRFDSMYLGAFEPMDDTSSWLVDPVDSNEASQMVSNKDSWVGSIMAPVMGSNN